jgi:hypothetical protein
MGRMSFTQELKELARVSEGMDAGGCWRGVREAEASGRCSLRFLIASRHAEREDPRSDHGEASDRDDSGWAPDERGSEVRAKATAASGRGGAIDHSFDSGGVGEAALAGDGCPEGEPVGERATVGWGVCAGERGERLLVAGAEVAGERGKCFGDLARALALDSRAREGDHSLIQAGWGRSSEKRPNQLGLAGGES